MFSVLSRRALRPLVVWKRMHLLSVELVDGIRNVQCEPQRCRCLSTSGALWAKQGKRGPPPASSDSSDSEGEVSGEMKAAVKAVAEALPGEKSHTESDLLKQLRQTRGGRQAAAPSTTQQASPTASSTSSSSSSLLKGMRVQTRRDRMETLDAKPPGPRPDVPRKGQQARPEAGRPQRRPEEDPSTREDFQLFGGKRLGVFSSPADPQQQQQPVAEGELASLWQCVRQEELERAASQPPANTWEEQIQWTREGKLWTFPINNEAGMVEEANVSFHEHIFLEPLLARFPTRGPVRHFMELVVVGLSKNPHMTVREKHEHINWFHDYFAQKQAVLEQTLGEEGIVAPVETQTVKSSAKKKAAVK